MKKINLEQAVQVGIRENCSDPVLSGLKVHGVWDPIVYNYWLLNVYCEIFGTSSYGEGRTSLRVRLRHMNVCQIFHNIHSIIFVLYTFYIYLLV